MVEIRQCCECCTGVSAVAAPALDEGLGAALRGGKPWRGLPV
ncbi:MAG: hypothetical protein PF961_15795 [Planctomycetota bacterium]|nr:hypothetical protein [Planctomycetota bacterium]